MHITIINIQDGRKYLESDSHYTAVRFNPLANSSFNIDWHLDVHGYTVSQREINTLMSLNQLRELRDALNKFLPEK
jgi:hypothetical protein